MTGILQLPVCRGISGRRIIESIGVQLPVVAELERSRRVDFTLTSGQVPQIAVGGAGHTGYASSGGSGGGGGGGSSYADPAATVSSVA